MTNPSGELKHIESLPPEKSSTPEWKTLIERRARAEWQWRLLLGAAVFFLLEVPLPPLPPRAALPSCFVMLLFSAYFFVRARRLPLREALLLSEENEHRLSATLLCARLGLDLRTAEATLRILEARGMVQLDDERLEHDELVYHVRGFL
ncbi:MAG: hypothetical protein H6727_09220 [Myxococcales bacterium]|nr:hypothetical protein [Myxococcales bacterium]